MYITTKHVAIALLAFMGCKVFASVMEDIEDHKMRLDNLEHKTKKAEAA